MPLTKIEYYSGADTYLVGRIDATFSRLAELWGEPDLGDGEKTQVEWVLSDEEGIVCCVYDWKEEKDPQLVTCWHVGGTAETLDKIKKSLLEYGLPMHN
jgi:hypothetical protein